MKANAPVWANDSCSGIHFRQRIILVKFQYDPQLVAGIKSIAQKWSARKAWQPETKTWRLPKKAARDIAALFVDLPQSPAFNELIRAYDAATARESEMMDNLTALSFDLAAPLKDGRFLYNHQKTGIVALLKARRFILADDMGLGKTMQALVAADLIRQAVGGWVVVICKASLMHGWHKEAGALGIGISAHSWAKLPIIPTGQPFTLIADEAHFAQNFKSQRTQAFLELAESAHAVFMLTGTPMRNGQPVNLYPLLRACRHPIARSKSDFELRYCRGQLKEIKVRGVTRKFWDARGADNLDELKVRVAPYIMRRLKSECVDLPEKTRVMREVEVSAEMKKLYTKTFEQSFAQYQHRVESGQIKSWTNEDGEVIGDGEALAILQFIRVAASIAKVETAVELAEEVIEQGAQPVIFTEFVDSARMIANHFKVHPYVGGIDARLQTRLVDDFQSGAMRPFIGTTAAGGIGLNLTAGSTVLLVDRPLVPGDADQAEDRLHRIGQRWPVTAIWLQAFQICKTIDKILDKKNEVITKVFAGQTKRVAGTGKVSPRQVLQTLFKDSQ